MNWVEKASMPVGGSRKIINILAFLAEKKQFWWNRF
jgi:hypothetical protein